MATLKVTNVKVYPVQMPNGKLRAIACVDIEDQLRLNSLRVYDGVNGLFVSYPTNTFSRDGEEYHQIFYTLNSEFRAEIEKAVLDEYSRVK